MDNMIGSMDLFSMFGIEKPAEKKNEETKKKETKKKSEAKGKSKAKDTLKFPFTVNSGYYEPLTVNEPGEDVASDEKTQIEFIKGVFEAGHPEYAGMLRFVKKDASTGYVFLEESRKQLKGAVSLKPETALYVFGERMDMSSVMTDTECSVDLSAIQKLVAEQNPAMGDSCILYVHEDKIVARPNASVSVTGVTFPVEFVAGNWLHDTVTAEEYEAFAKEQKLEYDSDESGPKAELSVLNRYFKTKYPEYGQLFSLGCVKGADHQVVVSFKESGSGTGAAGKAAAETYPTTGTKISLIFTTLDLSPELFGGKEEVTKAEVIAYLSKQYPEYSKDRTEILYDKGKKLIIPVLKGSKKGAMLTREEQKALEETHPYNLEFKNLQGMEFRSETLPWGSFSIAEKGTVGAFHLYLPKIPGEIFSRAEAFFAYVTEKYNTEAMLQVFWNPETREYELHCPRQTCMHASLACTRDNVLERERWLIMELHSHGVISSSFSSVDDADEMGTRLYGVFYGYDHKKQRFCGFDLRAGCGGRFLNLFETEVFESKPDEGNIRREADFSAWEKRMSVQVHEKCQKHFFVESFLKPLVLAADTYYRDVFYCKDEGSDEEYIDIVGLHDTTRVCVTFDTLMGIVRDVAAHL